jgi:hypothetical protein
MVNCGKQPPHPGGTSCRAAISEHQNRTFCALERRLPVPPLVSQNRRSVSASYSDRAANPSPSATAWGRGRTLATGDLQSLLANARHAPRKAHHSCLLLTRGAPGSGDRASTSRYPLVSALSPVVGGTRTAGIHDSRQRHPGHQDHAWRLRLRPCLRPLLPPGLRLPDPLFGRSHESAPSTASTRPLSMPTECSRWISTAGATPTAATPGRRSST